MTKASLIFFISSLLLISSSQARATEEKMRVAVVEFDEKGDIGIKDAGSIVAEWMVTSLGKMNKWQMVERVLLRDVLQEQGLGLTDVVDQETAAKIGKVYGVKRLVVGSVMRFGTSIFITARLINTDNADILRTAEVGTSDIGETREKTADLASLLAGAYGTLVISSIPLEAEVYLDDKFVARTPTTVEEVEKGKHRLVLKKEGYSEKEEFAEVKEGETTELEVSLSKLLGGNIQVETTPTGAKVYLDGTYRGKSPLALTDISPGPHEVKLEKEGRENYEERVTVERGKTATVKARLTEPRAILRIISDPEGAVIRIDERYFGLAPRQIDELGPGTHTLKLTKPGYEEYGTSVFLTPDDETLIEVKLERKSRPRLKSPLMAGIIAVPFLGCLGLGHFYAGDTRTGLWILGASALAALAASTTGPPATFEILIGTGAWLYDIFHAPTAARKYNERIMREYEQSLSSNLGLYARDNKIFLVMKKEF